MSLRITETDIRELELPPLPQLGNLIPCEMERDLHETLQDYARQALALHVRSTFASSAALPLSPEHAHAPEKRVVWVAYTNTDCTEGRGHDVPIATCAIEATALRSARKQYVQGSDGPVRELELVKVDGKWCAPAAVLNVIEPTPEDLAAQAALDMRRQAVAKAKAAGLTDAELRALGI